MLHDRIKECRLRAGLSQAQLATRLGVSRQAVTKWESGRGTPDIEHVKNLATTFGVSVDFLIADGSTAAGGTTFKEPLVLSEIEPHRQPGKPLGSRHHAAILQTFPDASAIWPLTRTRKRTRSQGVIEWVNALVFDGPFNVFTTADGLSSRDAHYLVEQPNRTLLSRVGEEFVESRELMEPPPAGRTFTVDRDVFRRAREPLRR